MHCKAERDRYEMLCFPDSFGCRSTLVHLREPIEHCAHVIGNLVLGREHFVLRLD